MTRRDPLPTDRTVATICVDCERSTDRPQSTPFGTMCPTCARIMQADITADKAL
jgi:hypothetical protein